MTRFMLLHDLRLALRSLVRTPGLTALTAGAIACGIGAAMVALTLYHARAGHPIWWKADQLFAVTLDNRDADHSDDRFAAHPEYPPFLMTYRDAKALYQSNIPTRSVRMFRSMRVVEPDRPGLKPFSATVRVTTADFFPMFDVPFLYGTGWTRSADDGPNPVVVLGRHLNEKLFGGANSVGKLVTLSGKQFRVIGVIDNWMPQPKFYDLSQGSFNIPEDLYMPFGWLTALKLPVAGNVWCTGTAKTGSFEALLSQDCNWLEYWVEMPTVQQRQRFQAFVDNYVRDQKGYGRFPRPLNNRIVNVPTWLAMNDVVGDGSRLLVGLGGLFLAVCILNTLGLMLAKFLGGAPVTGLRRALGASRRDIMRQHLIEVILVGILGGVCGIVLSWVGLWAVRVLTYVPAQDDNPAHLALAQSLSHMDVTMLLAAVAISVVTGILAGIYPAWRIGRLAPALFLKAQ
ncbi:MAG: ABC transporter permease [Steroidobacteraceae bacterium]